MPNICSLFEKKFFSNKKWIFLTFFRKSRFLTPPTLVKVQQREFQSKSAIRKKSFFRRFEAACKFSAKLTAKFTRTFQIFFSGYICIVTRTGQGPYPALNAWECSYSGHLGGRRGPGSGVCPESRGFEKFFERLFINMFICHMIDLTVIWQCPSGTDILIGWINSVFWNAANKFQKCSTMFWGIRKECFRSFWNPERACCGASPT